MDATTIVIAGIPAIGLVLALTEVVKLVAADRLAARWYPLVALGWALLLVGGGSLAADAAWFQALVAALVVGLAAVGLYSAGRRVARA